jgi:Family of unknown function (DUF5763)
MGRLVSFLISVFLILGISCGNSAGDKKLVGVKKGIATCYGYSPCNACTSCNYCKRCTAGGTCGTCTDLKRTKPKTPKSYTSPAKSSQCRAITKKGTRCSRKARSGGYCWQHGG